ncbi:MerR family transcriptional regulator [Ktedonobacter sp. SOSP1-52]|uniref:MerR family transcriptional regulator n=1 Tax=Ktedonobacter sp. SOSP1-52 TaxID=2778366 RepID=UPI001915C243|nr:MerR family transcriptional regulator [Ktedonobacter sp. SOSP1-52]GHO70341.1 MerR family transcriptional regulator [Ktedonobacter sp. SOSP1-52]
MLKIGEFARLSQVSIKTLRHYDALNVLRPARIYPESGYRLYEIGQLVDMVRILALKDCGFTLEEIARLLQTYDTKTVEALLHQRIAAQEQLVADEQARLQRMIARTQQLADADRVPLYDVALKQTEPLTLVGLRQCVATTAEIGPFAQMVMRHCEQHGVVSSGPLIHLYYDESQLDEGFDLFVGMSVTALPPSLADLCCERLAGGEQVACVIYRGDYRNISSAYSALDRWLSTSSYRIAGPCREIYHLNPTHTDDPASYITEIQYPLLPACDVS